MISLQTILLKVIPHQAQNHPKRIPLPAQLIFILLLLLLLLLLFLHVVIKTHRSFEKQLLFFASFFMMIKFSMFLKNSYWSSFYSMMIAIFPYYSKRTIVLFS
jgi:hypothetical protein